MRARSVRSSTTSPGARRQPAPVGDCGRSTRGVACATAPERQAAGSTGRRGRSTLAIRRAAALADAVGAGHRRDVDGRRGATQDVDVGARSSRGASARRGRPHRRAGHARARAPARWRAAKISAGQRRLQRPAARSAARCGRAGGEHRSRLQARIGSRGLAGVAVAARAASRSAIAPSRMRDHAVGGAGDARVVGDEHDRLAVARGARAGAPAPRARSRLSRLPVGSSASSTRGRLTSARAIATRCCWPPESAAGHRVGELREAEALEQLAPARRAPRGRERRPAARAARRCRRP